MNDAQVQILDAYLANFEIIKTIGYLIIGAETGAIVFMFKLILDLIKKGHEKEKITIEALSAFSMSVNGLNETLKETNYLTKETNQITTNILNKIEHPIISTLEKIDKSDKKDI